MHLDSYNDTIDSRDVIERIAELEAMKEEDPDFHDAAELQALINLADEASGSPDWPYGETLIRDSYFKEYAQELAEDCGMLNGDGWPNYCIDWEWAANDLKADYFSVDFDGVDYWIRG